ncbi:MAG TPA: ABC transporter permease, partial [Candidatus Sulfopaludibacter sp.]|nr:ABC transporter permease [Candidatus Sulfopaludibacter sp.]
MRWLYIVSLRLRSLFRRRQVEAELEEELAVHSEFQHRAGVLRMSAAELTRSKEQCRDMRRLNLLDDLALDLAYAARVLRKSPVFALAAAVTIALGIGAATAIFSVTNAVLLRPLPYRNADRLAVLNTFLSNAGYYDLRNGTTDLCDDMAAVMVFRTVVPREDGSAERINKGAITPNFLRMMGARIVLGRDFNEADGQPHGAVPPPFPWPPGNVAILSYDYFQRRYHGDPAVLGRELPATSGRGPRIAGVVAPGFKLYLPVTLAPMPDPEVWIAN